MDQNQAEQNYNSYVPNKFFQKSQWEIIARDGTELRRLSIRFTWLPTP